MGLAFMEARWGQFEQQRQLSEFLFYIITRSSPNLFSMR